MMNNHNNNYNNMPQNTQNLLTSCHNDEINTLRKKIQIQTNVHIDLNKQQKSQTNDERINEIKLRIQAAKKRLEEKKQKLVVLEQKIVQEREKGEQEPLLYGEKQQSQSSSQQPHTNNNTHPTSNITNEHIMAQLREHFKALKMQFQDLYQFDDDQQQYQDEVDVDNMTYEELLELGQKIGKVSKGLDVKKMQSLEVKKYHKCSESKQDSVVECAICRQQLQQNTEIIELPCAHIFHSQCIKGWLNVEKHCPNCKREISFDNKNNNKNQF